MYEDTKTIGLHLPSLSIRGFRGINLLDIERLGRVTEADLENAATQGIRYTKTVGPYRFARQRCYSEVVGAAHRLEMTWATSARFSGNDM